MIAPCARKRLCTSRLAIRAEIRTGYFRLIIIKAVLQRKGNPSKIAMKKKIYIFLDFGKAFVLHRSVATISPQEFCTSP